MIIIESVPERILNHGIHQGTVIHSVTIAGLWNCIRRHGHIFHTAGHYNIRITGHNHLRCLVDTVQTGTAHHIHGNCRHFDGQSCFDGCLTRYVLALSCLDDTSHVHLIYIFRLYSRPAQGFLDNNCTQLNYGGRAQCAAHGTDCGTACTG